jgi:hypothetical protein
MATAPIPPNDNIVDSDKVAAKTTATAGFSGEWDGTLLPPSGMHLPLWRSLLTNLHGRFFPESLPPLAITSTPVDVISPVGEILSLPWYRTIFTNVGDVIAPETLPPLQLESRPVDVGELVSDAMSRPWWSSLLRSVGERLAPETLAPLVLESQPVDVGDLISDVANQPWWTSLLRNVADRVSPEKLPPLHLSSPPVNPGVSSLGLVLPHWSSLLTVPRASFAEQLGTNQIAPNPPARPKTVDDAPETTAASALPVPLESIQVDADSLFAVVNQFQDNLSRSRRREILWVSAISLELLFLLGRYIGWV